MPIPVRAKSVRTTERVAIDETEDARASTRSAKDHPVSASAHTQTTREAAQITRLAHSQANRPHSLIPSSRATGENGQRSTVQHARTQSASMLGHERGGTVNARHLSKDTTPDSSRADLKPSYLSSKIRPPFDNHKQHFSPRKASVTTGPTRAEMTVQQDESSITSHLRHQLLHSACVYRGSLAKLEMFERSVSVAAAATQTEMGRDIEAFESLRAEHQSLVNADALYRYCIRDDGTTDMQRLRTLGISITELSSMTSASGAFTLCIEDFQKWLTAVQTSMENGDIRGCVQEVQPVNSSWLRSVEEVHSRLDVCEQMLSKTRHEDMLKDAALAQTVHQHCDLVITMRSALDESSNLALDVTKHLKEQRNKRLAEVIATVEDAAETPRHRRAVWT